MALASATIVHHMAALDGQPFPPNSLEAIQACLRAGAAWIEVDINALARDDYLLVHESRLEEETSSSGPVAACSPEQARRLSIRQAGKLTPYRVPLLSQVVACLHDQPGNTRLQLDFKNTRPFASPEPLERLARLVEPLGERVLISSGADWQLRLLRKLAPDLALGFDIQAYLRWLPEESRHEEEPPQRLGAYGYFDDHILARERSWSLPAYLSDRCESLANLVPGVRVLYLNYPLISQSLQDGFNWAESLHQRGILLDAWTMDVTQPAALQAAPALRAAGVDLFTSNTPLALAALLD